MQDLAQPAFDHKPLLQEDTYNPVHQDVGRHTVLGRLLLSREVPKGACFRSMLATCTVAIVRQLSHHLF